MLPRKPLTCTYALTPSKSSQTFDQDGHNGW